MQKNYLHVNQGVSEDVIIHIMTPMIITNYIHKHPLSRPCAWLRI